ncbi:hypothetical protein [Maridesulfovibrio sp.]
MLERKLQEKFEAWLQKKMATSKIKISKKLMPEIEESEQAAQHAEDVKAE